MLAVGSSAKWRSPNPLIPSLKDSSAPIESSSTRTPAGGSVVKRRASSSRATTAVPLSLAPGTTPRMPISVIAATVPSAEHEAGLGEERGRR